jgi:predicted transcriptional regulator
MGVDVTVETPTLYEVSEMSRDSGLVEERDTHLSVFLISLNGGFVIMSSPSRTGKDEVVDAAEFIRPGDDIAKIPSSTSPTVLYQRADELNDADIHRYPDITDLDEHIETLLKANGDGRSSSHEFTDATGEERTTIEQTIEPPNSMILFVASDNQNVDLNDYPEIRNRAIILSCDASADTTKKIKQRQAEMEVGTYEYRTTEKRREEIRQYVSKIPVDLYTNDDALGEVWNLTHQALADENPLPDLFPESRMDFARFNRFVKAVTMFKFGDRLEIGSERRDAVASLLTTPTDLWLAWKVFGEKMVLSALNLRDMDFEVLDMLRNSAQSMSVGEVMNEMRRRGTNPSDNQIRGALEGMLDKGYVIKDQGANRVKYQPSPFATPDKVSKDITMDFQNVVDQTKQSARQVLDSDVADEYISKFCEGSGLIATHPLEGGQHNITETGFMDEVSEREDDEEQKINETNPYDDNDDGGLQGTIGG